jgi:hypothetical protein
VNRLVLIGLVLLASRPPANQTASSSSVASLWTVEVLQQDSDNLGNRTPDASMQIPRDSPGLAFFEC